MGVRQKLILTRSLKKRLKLQDFLTVRSLNKVKDSIHIKKNIMLVYQNCHLDVVLSMAKKASKPKKAKNWGQQKMANKVENE